MMKNLRFLIWIVILAFPNAALSNQRDSDVESNSGKLGLTILDASTSKTIPCRVHLANAEGKPQLFDHLPSYRDHFCCDGQEVLSLPTGKYTYVIEHGPEYTRSKGSFEIKSGSLTQIKEKLSRIIDMASKGWWSGELHVHRPAKDIELLMQAEDLHIAPIITWWNKSNKWKNSKIPKTKVVNFDSNYFYELLGGEDERNGGAFMYFNMTAPVDITKAQREYPSPLHFIEQAKAQPDAWIDIEKPFWWDVPVALAYGYGDSIGLLNNHCWRSRMMDNEAWGKPRNKKDFPSPRGNGFWSQFIYYHILNSGIRIAPSAGSASGVLGNPVGYNRVYVYTGGENLNYSRWWENLRKGISFVTNGPLILPNVSGQKPGHVFKTGKGQKVKLDIKLHLVGNDPVHSIEIVKNGSVERTIPFAEFNKEGRLGVLQFTKSGWFLIRVTADIPNTFRFASTAPYYVEIGDEKHYLSRKSIRFFKDWIDERIGQINIDDSKKLEDVLKYHRKAKQFWQQRLSLTNAD
jgi:hypothetical protein